MEGAGVSKTLATIDLPYIERNKSRHGTMRYYLRFEGRRIGRLPDDTESEAFSVEYWRLRKLAETKSIAPAGPRALAGHPIPGSFRQLASFYLASSAYRKLDEQTRAKRRAIIDLMLLEPVVPGGADIFADMPWTELSVENIEVLRDRKAATPFAADERLKILRQIFETTQAGKNGKPQRIVRENTARLVEPFRVKTDGHHTIRPEEIEAYIRHHGKDSKATLAIAILMFTGLRVSDLAALGPQHRRGDKLMLRLFKNRNRSPVTLDLPLHPILAAMLDRQKPREMAYLLTEYGKPFSIKGLGNRISDWFAQANLPHCSAHAVRKGLATLIAENEATDAMLDGLFGWKDAKTSRIYTAKRRQAKLALQAIQRIDWGEMGNILPHPDQAVGSHDGDHEKKTG